MTDEKKWKEIKGYEGRYWVSDAGIVQSRWRTLTPTIMPKGYCRLALGSGNNKKNFLVHRLVALAFIPNPKKLPQINHKDGNKLNNHANNLEWCTCASNIKHSFDNNLVPQVGEKHRWSKLKRGDVTRIKELKKENPAMPLKILAAMFQVSTDNISAILRGKSWNR